MDRPATGMAFVPGNPPPLGGTMSRILCKDAVSQEIGGQPCAHSAFNRARNFPVAGKSISIFAVDSPANTAKEPDLTRAWIR